ncbi:hypothetical protein LLF88_03120 [bacterium]|nr:hypothetical protein [bacterium]
MSSPDGFFAVFKPRGLSSAKTLNVVKQLLAAEKAGFLGTLDVQAAGVLPVALGSATRLIPFLPSSDKEYVGELVLGMSTVTDDMDGEIIDRKGVAGLGDMDVKTAMDSVAAQETQVPPHVSAKRLGGVRGYSAVRKEGRLIDFAPTPVSVRSFTVLQDRLDGELRRIVFRMLVTPGFYVRGFCRDVGAALGCGACMGRLLRTRAYGFGVGDTLSLAKLRRMAESHDLSFVTTGQERKDLLGALPHVSLDGRNWNAFVHGVSVECGLMDETVISVIRPDGQLGGVGTVRAGRLYPRKVLDR